VVGEVFNVGTGEDLSILEVATIIREKMGNPAKSPIQFIGDRPGQVVRHTADVQKIGQVLGWKPKSHLRDRIEETIQWYSQNQSWWERQLWMRHIPILTAEGKKEMH
jgi:dTDP-glucose 4,6-dehydratase